MFSKTQIGSHIRNLSSTIDNGAALAGSLAVEKELQRNKIFKRLIEEKTTPEDKKEEKKHSPITTLATKLISLPELKVLSFEEKFKKLIKDKSIIKKIKNTTSGAIKLLGDLKDRKNVADIERHKELLAAQENLINELATERKEFDSKKIQSLFIEYKKSVSEIYNTVQDATKRAHLLIDLNYIDAIIKATETDMIYQIQSIGDKARSKLQSDRKTTWTHIAGIPRKITIEPSVEKKLDQEIDSIISILKQCWRNALARYFLTEELILAQTKELEKKISLAEAEGIKTIERRIAERKAQTSTLEEYKLKMDNFRNQLKQKTQTLIEALKGADEASLENALTEFEKFPVDIKQGINLKLIKLAIEEKAKQQKILSELIEPLSKSLDKPDPDAIEMLKNQLATLEPIKQHILTQSDKSIVEAVLKKFSISNLQKYEQLLAEQKIGLKAEEKLDWQAERKLALSAAEILLKLKNKFTKTVTELDGLSIDPSYSDEVKTDTKKSVLTVYMLIASAVLPSIESLRKKLSWEKNPTAKDLELQKLITVLETSPDDVAASDEAIITKIIELDTLEDTLIKAIKSKHPSSAEHMQAFKDHFETIMDHPPALLLRNLDAMFLALDYIHHQQRYMEQFLKTRLEWDANKIQLQEESEKLQKMLSALQKDLDARQKEQRAQSDEDKQDDATWPLFIALDAAPLFVTRDTAHAQLLYTNQIDLFKEIINSLRDFDTPEQIYGKLFGPFTRNSEILKNITDYINEGNDLTLPANIFYTTCSLVPPTEKSYVFDPSIILRHTDREQQFIDIPDKAAAFYTGWKDRIEGRKPRSKTPAYQQAYVVAKDYKDYDDDANIKNLFNAYKIFRVPTVTSEDKSTIEKSSIEQFEISKSAAESRSKHKSIIDDALLTRELKEGEKGYKKLETAEKKKAESRASSRMSTHTDSHRTTLTSPHGEPSKSKQLTRGLSFSMVRPSQAKSSRRRTAEPVAIDDKRPGATLAFAARPSSHLIVPSPRPLGKRSSVNTRGGIRISGTLLLHDPRSQDKQDEHEPSNSASSTSVSGQKTHRKRAINLSIVAEALKPDETSTPSSKRKNRNTGGSTGTIIDTLGSGSSIDGQVRDPDFPAPETPSLPTLHVTFDLPGTVNEPAKPKEADELKHRKNR